MKLFLILSLCAIHHLVASSEFEGKTKHEILREKTQKFMEWFGAHSPEKSHKCFDTDSPSCRHGVHLALDIMGKDFMNPNGCIDTSSCDLKLVPGMNGKKAMENQPKWEKERRSTAELALKNKQDNQRMFAALTSKKEFIPSIHKYSRESTTNENEFTPTAREFSPESTTDEFTNTRKFSRESTTDEIPQEDDPTHVSIPCSKIEDKNCKMYRLSPNRLKDNFAVKYSDENKIVGEYRIQVNGESEGKKYGLYGRSRNGLNAKREIIAERENVLLHREKLEGKTGRTQKLYQIPRSVVKTKNESDMHPNVGVEYVIHATAQVENKMKKIYQIPQSVVKTKNESDMHPNVGVEYVIHETAALVEKKMRLYRISRVLFPIKYELSNLEQLLANLYKMQPAEMRTHLKKLTGTAFNSNWKRPKLQAKLQQLWNAKCDSLRAHLSDKQDLNRRLNRKTEPNDADAKREIFTKFMKMISCPAREIRVNQDGRIESTLYWKNIPIRCIHTNEKTVERFMYHNKEFTMDKVTGTAIQYAPTTGQQNETIEVIEIGYQMPYECCDVMKRKVETIVFLNGGAHYAVERSWKEGILKIKPISLEDLEITRIATQKQLQKIYLDQLLK